MGLFDKLKGRMTDRLTERAAQCVSVPSTPGCPEATPGVGGSEPSPAASS